MLLWSDLSPSQPVRARLFRFESCENGSGPVVAGLVGFEPVKTGLSLSGPVSDGLVGFEPVKTGLRRSRPNSAGLLEFEPGKTVLSRSGPV